MKKTNTVTRMVTTMIALLCVCLNARAAEVVYRIVEYNKSTQEFSLAASGTVPKDAWAEFENDYGATTGNRYNQIPRNRQATLYLEGWQGCTIRSITLSMCSNSKKGQVGLAVNDGGTRLYRQAPVDFADPSWYGQWVSKDLNVYVDIKKQLNIPAITSSEASIVIQGGSAEGSVYLDAVAIEYDGPEDAPQESPLGWSYEKLTKKSVLHDGDQLMLYRNGCAATDYDGMAESHYLDVVAIASTADVSEPDVLRFTLGKGSADGLWTLTDQHGRRLCASGKQSLSWDDGNGDWAIELGYDGATITGGNGKYGTIRYNAPTSGYTRFGLYTSTSLPLPFLYRRDKQKEPVVSNALTIDQTAVTVSLSEGHTALHTTVLPTATTDKRITWTSSDEDVATVNGGFVTLLATGHTTITARTRDGGAEATVSLTVTEPTGISSPTEISKSSATTRKVLEGGTVTIIKNGDKYGVDGLKITPNGN